MSVESDEVRYYRELDREAALERAIENRVEDLLKDEEFIHEFETDTMIDLVADLTHYTTEREEACEIGGKIWDLLRKTAEDKAYQSIMDSD